jgi:hypothetical protein
VSSEYEPLFARERAAAVDDLGAVQDLFRAASGPYLRSWWSWAAWALILPAAAFATGPLLARRGPAGVLLTWSAAILVGGAVEIGAIARARRREQRAQPLTVRPPGRSLLAAWVMRTQGNLSLVALALSILLVWLDQSWLLPGLWLLLLGHSFFVLGGVAFPPFRVYGLVYQAGGLACLWPGGAPLAVFALATAVGNLWMGWAVWREQRALGPGG